MPAPQHLEVGGTPRRLIKIHPKLSTPAGGPLCKDALHVLRDPASGRRRQATHPDDLVFPRLASWARQQVGPVHLLGVPEGQGLLEASYPSTNRGRHRQPPGALQRTQVLEPILGALRRPEHRHVVVLHKETNVPGVVGPVAEHFQLGLVTLHG